MGGFFSAEHHPIYDDKDIEQLRGWLQRFGIFKDERKTILGARDDVRTTNNTQRGSKVSLDCAGWGSIGTRCETSKQTL